jgi:peptide/nickel transport system ATP-binding protein
MTALLEVRDLTVRVGTGQTVLAGVSYAVDAGGAIAIVGESGAGKTVTALTTIGLSRAPGTVIEGQIVFGERDLVTLSDAQLRRLRGNEIATLLGDPSAALDPQRSLGAQLGEAVLTHREVSDAAARDRAIDLLELVGIPDPHRAVDGRPHEFSAGMRLRGALALALTGEPALLIADDPTRGLDATVQAQILALLAELRRRLGLALVLGTRDPGIAAELTEEIYVLREGRLVERGPAARVLTAPAEPYTRALLAGTPRLDRRRLGAEAPAESGEFGAPLLAVGSLLYRAPRRLPRRGGPAITLVDGISFELRQGATLGIIGESGCGKSTLAGLLAGRLSATSGTLRLESEAPVPLLLAGGALAPARTAAASVAEPLRAAARGGDKAPRRTRAEELLARVGLTPGDGDRYPHELAPGDRVRVAIACALAAEPALIVADDPLASLDGPVQMELLTLLRELVRERELAMVFLGRDPAVVRDIGDRVAVMYLGTVVELAQADWLYGDPRHPYSGLLLSAATVPDPAAGRRRRQLLTGEAPGLAEHPAGCRFHPRCPRAQALCAEQEPVMRELAHGTITACHFPLTREQLTAR